jgi:hypothetical protein
MLELIFFLMASLLPASFPATRRGYNAYLKALGLNPKDSDQVFNFGITFHAFQSVDRHSIEEKIAYAGQRCEELYNEYELATMQGRTASAEMADNGWSHWSKIFTDLTKQNTNAMKKGIDFSIDEKDLKVLFAHTMHCYPNMSFEAWCKEVKEVYTDFIKGKESPKTFSQWINGQTIALTTGCY